MLNKFKRNIISSKSNIIFLSITSFLFLFLFGLFFRLSFSSIVAASIFFLLFNLILLYLVGGQRNKELDSIKDVISRIRTHSVNFDNEISLGSELEELEIEIKAMFLRSQNDIQNLKKLEQIRTEFLGNVSHELRTPIFAIQGYIETLLDGALDDRLVNRTFLQKANQHTINLNNLLNDLIDISMIESGEMKMSFRYFNVSEFFDSVLNEFKPQAVKKNIELQLLPFNHSLQLFGDKQRLKQAISNLLMNALKYTESGSIKIGVYEEENGAVIFVMDSGIGISKNDLERIFERFYRVDKERSRDLGGTGLGLAIVKHIVEAHGSIIEVKSEIGKGSKFSFRLKK